MLSLLTHQLRRRISRVIFLLIKNEAKRGSSDAIGSKHTHRYCNHDGPTKRSQINSDSHGDDDDYDNNDDGDDEQEASTSHIFVICEKTIV